MTKLNIFLVYMFSYIITINQTFGIIKCINIMKILKINYRLRVIHITYVLFFMFMSLNFVNAQNIVQNGDFETGDLTNWIGFNNQVVTDNLTSSFVGNANNGGASLRQDVPIAGSTDYTLTFDYRWVSGSGNYNMTVRAKADSNGNDLGTLVLSTTPDQWFSGSISFTTPASETDVRLMFFKANGNRPFRLDNVVLTADTAVPCDPPSNVTNPAVASESAYFKWDLSPSDFDGYDWTVTSSGGNPDTPADVVQDGQVPNLVTHVSVFSLTDNTNYDFHVRTRCDGEKSSWEGPLSFTTSFQGNLIANSRYQDDGSGTAAPSGWSGFNHQSLVDEEVGSLVGNVNNGEGSFFQIVNVVPGESYALSFDYRWVSGSGNYNMNAVIRDESTSNIIQSVALNTTPDQWFSKTITFTSGSDESELRILFFKTNGNRPFRLDNVSILQTLDLSSEADFIYQNGTWSPSSPVGSSTTTDDIIVFNGRTTISGDVDANNLTVKPWADVDVESTLNLNTQLTVENGGVLTFKSDASGFGQLESGSVSGNVTVERFIPAGDNNKRAFRFLASSVNSTNFIRDNWQEKGRNNVINLGTHITGSTIDGNKGFDGTTSGQASLLMFDNGTQTWGSIDNTDNTNLETGKAYNLFVRGDRSIDLTSSSQTPTNTTLRATGSLVTGNVDFTTTSTPQLATGNEEWNFIGNPYQSIVDFTALTITDVKSTFFYAWNPNENTNGKYELYDNTVSTPSPMIQPGQSFFVQNSTTATSPLITFTEAAKNTSGTVTTVFDDNSLAIADLELYDANNSKLDVMLFRFESGANNGIDDFDAGKLGNPNENLASVNTNTLLALERRDIPQQDEIIPLQIEQYQFTQYEFKLNTANWDDNIDVYILDDYLNTQTLIDDSQVYSFNIDSSIPESVASDRFSLIFDNTTLGVNDNSFGDNFSLYPNPTQDGLFSIKTQNLNAKNVDISIHNLMGQQHLKQEYEVESNGVININARDLSAGVYMIKLHQDNKNFTTKLIIQ